MIFVRFEEEEEDEDEEEEEEEEEEEDEEEEALRTRFDMMLVCQVWLPWRGLSKLKFEFKKCEKQAGDSHIKC